MKNYIFLFILFFLFSNIFADIIILKDEQKFEADVLNFDEYYLNVKLKNNKEISIPWNEVSFIKHTTTPSSWLEETHMSSDDVDVKTLVVPLSPDTAFYKSLFPGIVWHGAGHFYAKDSNTGFSLLSAEIVSLAIITMSVNELLTPIKEGQTYNVSRIVFYTGLTLFTGSWLYDIIFSRGAVEKFNRENKFLAEEEHN